MHPNYLECDRCGQIELEKNCGARDAKVTCRHCECSLTREWPGSELAELVNFILSFSQSQPRYSQVASVFLASIFELLLEQLLTTMLYMDLLYDEVCILVDALIESHQGRSRMLELYRKVGYGSFREEATGLGFTDFVNNWDSVVSARNKIVHGKTEEASELEPEMVERTILDGLEVFRLLHNKYKKESLAYTSATDPVLARQRELEKLKEWNEAFGTTP